MLSEEKDLKMADFSTYKWTRGIDKEGKANFLKKTIKMTCFKQFIVTIMSFRILLKAGREIFAID